MGWNAGGFGSMRFPSTEALEAWKESTVSHAEWGDWINELEGSYAPEETVEERLATVAHQRASFMALEVTIDGTTVKLVYDDGEDGFREGSGDVAALVRGGAAFGAKGRFWFLGTAGAEGDFVYELTLDGKTSKLKELAGAVSGKVYASKEYQAFCERVMALLEASNPAFKKLMTKVREGEPASSKGASLHERVTAELAAFSDAQLAATAKKFPSLVPVGSGSVLARQAFRKAGDVRAMLGEAKNEELRAVSLWVLGQLAPAIALPLAFEALKKGTEPMRAAALRVLGAAKGDDRALELVLGTFTAPNPPLMVQYAALDAARELQHAGLEDALRAVLAKLSKTKGKGYPNPAQLVVALIEQRHLRGLATNLARFAVSKGDTVARVAAAKRVVEWKDREAMKVLLARLGEEYGVADAAARAWLELEPDEAWAHASRVAKSKRRVSADDRKLHGVLGALRERLRGKKALDARWVDLCLSLLALGDHYLAHTALDVLGHARREARIVKRLEQVLASGTVPPIGVVEALRGQGARNVKALVAARLRKATNARERGQLQLLA